MRGRKARLERNLWEQLWFEARRKIARAGSRGASAMALAASLCAASMNTGSFSVVSACSGVFVRIRLTVHVSPVGASKFIIAGYELVRRMNV